MAKSKQQMAKSKQDSPPDNALWEFRVLAALTENPQHLNQIIEQAEDLSIGLDDTGVVSTLFQLELEGKATQLPGKKFVRTT